MPSAPQIQTGNVTVCSLEPQIPISNVTVAPSVEPMVLEARPLEIPKEWLEKAPLPTSPLTPPFDTGTTPAPAIQPKIDVPVTPVPDMSKMSPVPSPYEWTQPKTPVGTPPPAPEVLVGETAAYSYLESAYGTLKWAGTATLVLSIASIAAPVLAPVAAGSAIIAGVVKGGEALVDAAAGNYGIAALKVAQVGLGPALGAAGSLIGKVSVIAGSAATVSAATQPGVTETAKEIMTIGARVFNDPERMKELAGGGWKLIEIGQKGAEYIRSGGDVTNYLMEGGRFVLKRVVG
jgi:hypothetical protein